MMRPAPLALAFALAAALPSSAFATDLLQTYELARQADPQLAAAEANNRATREGSVQALAAMLPQLDATATLNRSRSSGPDTRTQLGSSGPIQFSGDSETDTTTRRYGVNLQQMIYDHSRVTALRSQKALGKAGDYTLISAGDDLVTRTSAAYFNVLVAIETLAAAESAETALKRQFDYADKRLEVGLAPITDVHEARAQYDSARANTIVQRNALQDAYQALREITGTPVSNLKGLPEDFKPSLPADTGADGWVESAIQNNPELQAQQYRVKSAEADVSTARAGHFPTLYLSGGYGKDATWGDSTFNSSNPPFSSTFPIDSQSKGPSLGITLSVPIFSGGATQSRVRQAIARRDAAQDQYEQQKRAVDRNVRNLYQTLVAGISEVEARRLAVVSAKAAYDASQVGLEVGTRTVLDVLINQRNLFDARQQYALAKYNYLQNRLLLEQAAGSLDIDDVQDINRLLTVDAEAQLSSGADTQPLQ